MREKKRERDDARDQRPTDARSSGWCIAVHRADQQPTTEAEERAAMAALDIEGEERLCEGGWIASIPIEHAGPDGADIDVDIDGVAWLVEIPSV